MRRAFVMGSNGPAEYDPLRYALKDVENIKACLSGPRCRFDVVSPKPESDTYKLRQQLDLIAESCTTEDTFICYFSGHGFLEKGELFLLWDNTRFDNLLSTAVPVSNIIIALSYCRAHSKLLILDCCHAGAIVKMTGLKDRDRMPVEKIVIKPDNSLVLMASGKLEKARELEKLNGSFLTANICSALGDDFHEADKDNDHKLSIYDLKNWLEEKAKEHNRQFPDESVPYPYFFGQQKGNFFLTLDDCDWLPYEIPWPYEITMVVLPIRPENGKVFCISKHPVTNGQYKKFVEDGWGREPVGEHCSQDSIVKTPYNNRVYAGYPWKGPFYPWREDEFRDPDKPVVCVSYHNAVFYCEWLTEKFREFNSHHYYAKLITPQVWEFAAFGTEFPVLDPNIWLKQTQRLHHKSSAPAPIDRDGIRTNARGIADMFGNVWEWCFTEDQGYVEEGIVPPRRYDKDNFGRINPELRGGSFLNDLSKSEYKPFLEAAALQNGSNTCHSDLGFRIATEVFTNDLPENVQLQLSLCKPLPPRSPSFKRRASNPSLYPADFKAKDYNL